MARFAGCLPSAHTWCNPSPQFNASGYCIRSNKKCRPTAERDNKPAYESASASFTWLDTLELIPSRPYKMVSFHLTIFHIPQLTYKSSKTGRLNGDNLQPSANPSLIDYKDVVTGSKHCAARYVHAYILYTRIKGLFTQGSPERFDDRNLWRWILDFERSSTSFSTVLRKTDLGS